VHDLKISRAQRIIRGFTGYQHPPSNIPAASRLVVADFSQLFDPLTGADLSRDEVETIAARWNGMKELAATYLITNLNHVFQETTLPYIPRKVLDGPLSPDELHPFYLDQQLLRFSRDQDKDTFYRRFYHAGSALWLLTEAITLANAVQYTDVAEYKETRATVTFLLDGLSAKDLFTVCEVENFLYGFLLPKIFAPYAQSWSFFCTYAAGDLGFHTTFFDTWKRFMKIARLSFSPGDIIEWLAFMSRATNLPRIALSIRGLTAFGLREWNMMGRITNVTGLGGNQRPDPIDFNAKSLQSCVARTLLQLPAFEGVSLSAARAGWESFNAGEDPMASWKCNVKGQLALLDRDWDDWRFAGLYDHVIANQRAELALKEQKKLANKAKREAARAEAARLAQQQADETVDEDAMDVD
jgi:hypothetical protein